MAEGTVWLRFEVKGECSMKRVYLSDGAYDTLQQYAADSNQQLIDALSEIVEDWVSTIGTARTKPANFEQYESDFGKRLDRLSANAERMAANFAALEEGREQFSQLQEEFNRNVVEFAAHVPAGKA